MNGEVAGSQQTTVFDILVAQLRSAVYDDQLECLTRFYNHTFCTAAGQLSMGLTKRVYVPGSWWGRVVQW